MSLFFILVLVTGIAPVPWVLRPAIGGMLRRLLRPSTGTILRLRNHLSSLSARLRSFFKALRSLKDVAPSFKALRTSLKSMRPSFKGGFEDLVYGTPAPQVNFYDAPNPSYEATPPPSYEGQGFKRSVKQFFFITSYHETYIFPLQFQEESKTLSELVLKNFEELETQNPQFSFDAFATALKAAQKQLQ